MRAAIWASLLALILLGCTTGAHPADWESLLGRSLVSVSVTSGGQPVTLVPGSALSIRFYVQRPAGFADRNAFSASGGCNGFGAPTSVGNGETPPSFGADGILRIPDGMGTSIMGCPGPEAEQDNWFAAFLQASPRVLIDGNTVVMSSGDTVVTMIDKK